MDATTDPRTENVSVPAPTAGSTNAGLPAEPFATYRKPLERAAELALRYLEGLPERRVGAEPALVEQVRASFGRPLPEEGEDPEKVIDELSTAADPGLTAMNGPRYFGFVIGGTLPAALAADWLASAWDQNAGMHIPTPAAAAAEVTAGAWLVDLLGLAPGTSVGFTTGATTANLTCMAAARHEVLRRAGWDVEADGLQGAPRVTVIAGEEVHPSMLKALRLVGLGQRTGRRVAVDDQGRMRLDALRRALSAAEGPVIVLAQLGNVNSGAFDPLEGIVPLVRELPNAWLHVDGAFGLWAGASPRLRPLAAGLSEVDSAATDAHKWLNTPYDTGLAFIRNDAAIRAAMSIAAAYLPASPADRDPFEYVPEMSRRARGFPVYAALRSLGRRGLGDMIERGCAVAALMAERLATDPAVHILNDVVLNQVLVRFGGDDALTDEIVRRVQADGTIWAGGTVWHGLGAMRISVSCWSTGEADALRSVEAILLALREAKRP
ncbi:MAG: pyridoxal-dependent decarboxylase [Candidatus Limnocylindrales bacterium]|jgi:glutamate/tyrosine decarboxylase-like PLP-dependent enzyme